MDDLPPLLIASTPDHISNNPGADYDVYLGTDFAYQPDPITKAVESQNLRLITSYATFLDAVYDQGRMGSCVANSTAALYRFEFKRHIQDAKLQNKHFVDPARLFIYYNARRLLQFRPIGDSGSQNRDSLHGLEKWGICEENSFKYVMLRRQEGGETDAAYKQYKNEKSSKIPTEDIYTEALNHRIKGYYRLDIDRDPNKSITQEAMESDGQHVLNNVKLCLTEGHPFILSFFWEKAKDNLLWTKRQNGDWSFSSLVNFKPKNAPIPGDRYGHSVLGIGYDKDGILCQNSWGAGAEYLATFWIPWEWVTDYTATNDFWMIRVVGD